MQRLRAWKHWPTARSLLLVLVFYVGLRAFQQRNLPGGAAPALSGVNLSGEQVSLRDYQGEAVIVHFWATWCGVCRAEQHNISAVAEDLPMLTIASLSGHEVEVKRYARENDLQLPIVNDPSGVLAKRFGVSAFPTTFIVDAEGNIRHAEVGYTTELGLRFRMWLASW